MLSRVFTSLIVSTIYGILRTLYHKIWGRNRAGLAIRLAIKAEEIFRAFLIRYYNFCQCQGAIGRFGMTREGKNEECGPKRQEQKRKYELLSAEKSENKRWMLRSESNIKSPAINCLHVQNTDRKC